MAFDHKWFQYSTHRSAPQLFLYMQKWCSYKCIMCMNVLCTCSGRKLINIRYMHAIIYECIACYYNRKQRYTTFLWNVKTHGLPKPYIEVNSVALMKLVSSFRRPVWLHSQHLYHNHATKPILTCERSSNANPLPLLMLHGCLKEETNITHFSTMTTIS